jgi:hypothetical protein
MKIIIDTREKQYWDFSMYDAYDVVHQKLDAGDYSLEGYEHLVAIERKASTGEINRNVNESNSRRKQFEAELEKMSVLKYKYIICEFSLEDFYLFPENSGIPKKRWPYLKRGGMFVLKSLYELANKYEVEVLFCGTRFDACAKTIEIFNEVRNNEDT